jgi:hypothetical protein
MTLTTLLVMVSKFCYCDTSIVVDVLISGFMISLKKRSINYDGDSRNIYSRVPLNQKAGFSTLTKLLIAFVTLVAPSAKKNPEN